MGSDDRLFQHVEAVLPPKQFTRKHVERRSKYPGCKGTTNGGSMGTTVLRKLRSFHDMLAVPSYRWRRTRNRGPHALRRFRASQASVKAFEHRRRNSSGASFAARPSESGISTSGASKGSVRRDRGPTQVKLRTFQLSSFSNPQEREHP
jgi:hypothetical protein